MKPHQREQLQKHFRTALEDIVKPLVLPDTKGMRAVMEGFAAELSRYEQLNVEFVPIIGAEAETEIGGVVRVLGESVVSVDYTAKPPTLWWGMPGGLHAGALRSAEDLGTKLRRSLATGGVLRAQVENAVKLVFGEGE